MKCPVKNQDINSQSSNQMNAIGYQLIDTHTHLCDPIFDPDRDDIISRAKAAGVAKIISVSENMADANRNLELAGIYPEILPAAGQYPTHLDLSQSQEMVEFIRANRDRLVAIGEVGLDFWVVKEEGDKEIQKQIFAGFIDLSIELDLPLNIHSRSAGRHAVALLLERGAKKVQLHAFDGKAGAAMPAVEAGYYFSIPPSVVRSAQKQKMVKQLPLSCLLLETDSPVLGPTPNERNEPKNILLVVAKIAELKNVNPKSVLEAVSENSRNLYGKLQKQ
jgi:TatD DNase family protein